MTTPTTKISMSSSVRRRPRGSGVGPGLAVLPGAGVGAQRLVWTGWRSRSRSYPPVPLAVLAGAGQSAGKAGFGGLTFW